MAGPSRAEAVERVLPRATGTSEELRVVDDAIGDAASRRSAAITASPPTKYTYRNRYANLPHTSSLNYCNFPAEYLRKKFISIVNLNKS